MALGHLTVDGDLLPRPHQHDVAGNELLDGQVGFGAAADHPGGPGTQAQQGPDGLSGAGLGPGLQQPTHQDQGSG